MAQISARSLPFPQAREHADLYLIAEDLKHCDWCCSYFLDRGTYINTMSSPNDRAIFDSMLLSYRRCFTTGVRSSLKAIPIERILQNEEDVKCHEMILNVSNQHVAHSVNRMEEWFTRVSVATDADGKILRWGGINEGGTSVSGISLPEVASLQVVVNKHLDSYIRPRREELKLELDILIADMTLEDVRELPNGVTIGTKGQEHLQKRKNR